MGCAQSGSKPSEEEAIIKAENALKFQFHSSTGLDLCFRKFSIKEKLNSLQFTRAANSLNLQISNSGVYDQITRTLNKLKDSEGNYKLLDLIVISVFLGKDSLETKGKILYQCFDKELLGYLDRGSLNDLASCLVRIAVDVLGGLVSDGQSPYSSELRNTKYLADMNSVKIIVCNRLVDFIMAGLEKIDEGEFTERISFYNEGNFLTAVGVREVLYLTYFSMVPRKSFLTGPSPYRPLRSDLPRKV